MPLFIIKAEYIDDKGHSALIEGVEMVNGSSEEDVVDCIANNLCDYFGLHPLELKKKIRVKSFKVFKGTRARDEGIAPRRIS